MKKTITYSRKYPLTLLGPYNMSESSVTLEFDIDEYPVAQAFKEARDNVLTIMQQDLDEIAKAQARGEIFKPQVQKTLWRVTKNPTIEWCPGNEASEEDIARAKDNDDKEVWFLKNENNGISIFKRISLKKDEP